jgi:hypothetical protein
MEAAKPLNEKNKELEAFGGRRRHPRKEFVRDVGVLYKGEYVLEMTTDISESGVSFISAREIPVGHNAVVTFQIPNGTMVSVTVEVRGHFKNPKGFIRTGCVYKNIRFECKREIRNFVSARE